MPSSTPSAGFDVVAVLWSNGLNDRLTFGSRRGAALRRLESVTSAMTADDAGTGPASTELPPEPEDTMSKDALISEMRAAAASMVTAVAAAENEDWSAAENGLMDAQERGSRLPSRTQQHARLSTTGRNGRTRRSAYVRRRML